MPAWIENLPAELKAIEAAPAIFVLVVAALAVGVWVLLSWSYRSQLSNKDAQLESKRSEIELLERQLSDFKQKLHGASPDEAKARIDELERQVKELMPRKLSPEQKQMIEQQLRRLGSSHSITIAHDMSCSDGGKYADDFGRLFQALGWKVSRPSVLGVSGPPPSGLGILISGGLPVGIESELGEALKRAGVGFDYRSHPPRAVPANQQTELELLISHRAAP